jgi:hypothetical protein
MVMFYSQKTTSTVNFEEEKSLNDTYALWGRLTDSYLPENVNILI